MPRSKTHYPDHRVTCACCEQYQELPGQHQGRCEAMDDVLRMEGYPDCTVMVREDRKCAECDLFDPSRSYLAERSAELAEADSIRRDRRAA